MIAAADESSLTVTAQAAETPVRAVAVIIAAPPDIPVTTPVKSDALFGLTIATAGLLEDQVTESVWFDGVSEAIRSAVSCFESVKAFAESVIPVAGTADVRTNS